MQLCLCLNVDIYLGACVHENAYMFVYFHVPMSILMLIFLLAVHTYFVVSMYICMLIDVQVCMCVCICIHECICVYRSDVTLTCCFSVAICLMFRYRVSHWPRTLYVLEVADQEVLEICLPYITSTCHHTWLCVKSSTDSTQVRLLASQMLYQLSYLSSPALCFIRHYWCLNISWVSLIYWLDTKLNLDWQKM